jgi:hypothetical protein
MYFHMLNYFQDFTDMAYVIIKYSRHLISLLLDMKQIKRGKYFVSKNLAL